MFQVFRSIAAEVTQLKEDDIRSFSLEKLSIFGAKFRDFYNYLAESVTTGEATLPEWPQSSPSSGDLSSSGDEDQAEQSARSCLVSLVTGIVAMPTLLKIVPGWEFAVYVPNASSTCT